MLGFGMEGAMKGKGLFALPAALALAVLTVTLLADCPAEIESGGEAPAQTPPVSILYLYFGVHTK
jgi:hypothetical protein